MIFEKDLDLVLQETMIRWDIPGLAVGIVEGEEIVYAKGFGVQSLDTQAPVSTDSVFCVQSVSKCFVATAVMQLVERGLLQLDAPLVESLPYFRMDDERFPQITIRQVLSHTSGMPDIEETDYVEWMTHPEVDDGAAERFVRSLQVKKLIADPGERFRYSNSAYNVLGDLLARVSASSFESVMKEQVLVPAGMPNSTFMPAEIPSHLLSMPHLRSPEMKVNPIYPYQRADSPASSLHASLLEMCHWAITSLNRGSYRGQSILSPAGYEQMWTAVTSRGNWRPSIYEEMGLGWTLGHHKGARTVSHGGAGFGGSSFLLILPEKNCAVVILCNEESDAHYLAAEAAADVLLGLKPLVSKVSWMVPASRALAKGGIGAVSACYAEIKASGLEEVEFDEGALINLSLQLFSANRIDLAIAVLGLNIQVYPELIESYLAQARLYQVKGETSQAKACLWQALSIEPENTAAASLLALSP